MLSMILGEAKLAHRQQPLKKLTFGLSFSDIAVGTVQEDKRANCNVIIMAREVHTKKKFRNTEHGTSRVCHHIMPIKNQNGVK